jgi:hypothetical protein
MRTMLKVLAAGAALALVSPAFAQGNPLTYNGVTFDAHDGWCPRQVMANGAMTLEIKYCANPDRYVSVLLMRPPAAGQTYDVANMAKVAVEFLEGPQGKGVIEDSMNAGYGNCTASDLAVERNAVPGLPGFRFSAVGTCTKDGATDRIDFANFSAYVVGKDGALWSIAFDHAQQAITADEATILKAIANRIAGR